MKYLMIFLTLIDFSSVAKAEPQLASVFSSACSTKEIWANLKLKKEWKEKFFKPYDSDVNDKNLLSYIWSQKKLNTDPMLVPFFDYWAARSLYRQGLVTLAFRGFMDLAAIKVDSTNRPYYFAAQECLGSILRKYPSMIVPDELFSKLLADSIPNITPKEKILNIGFLVPVGLQYLMNSSESSKLSTLMERLKSSPVFRPYLLAINAARTGDANKVIDNIALLDPVLPKLKAELRSSLHFLRAQSYYSLEKYPEAIAAFNKVDANSNYFAQGKLGVAWASLQQEKYSDAVGQAYNLLVGPLQYTFNPEAYSVMAISMNENCDYPRAVETIKLYKKAYEPVYHWIKNWEKAKSPLYQELVNYLKDQSKISNYIGMEWIRNPAFISKQDEMNLILGEQAKMAEILKRTTPETLQTFLKSEMNLGNSRNRILVKEVNQQLEADTIRMRQILDEVSENLQLVQAEVYSSVGEKMIADNAGIKVNSTTKEEGRNSKAAVWDWGAYHPGAAVDPEVWEDELGFLQAKIVYKCNK